MANNFDFQISFPDMGDFIRELEMMPDAADNHIGDAIIEYGMLLEEGSRALAPYDSGDLVNSLQFKSLQRMAGRIEGAVGSEIAYAMRTHEAPDTPGTRDKYDNGVKFERYYLNGKGRRTHRKPAWRGQRAGRKYLERAAVATEKDFEELMNEAYEKTIRGRRG